MIPGPSRRSTSLTPAQIFSAGYRDGQAHRPHHPQFDQHPDYLRGYVAGCHSQAAAIPNPAVTLMLCFSWSNLDGALHSIQQWEDDQARLGFGAVALSFSNGWWRVLISEDLYDAVLPF